MSHRVTLQKKKKICILVMFITESFFYYDFSLISK